MKISLKYRIAGLIFILEAVMMAVVLWATLSYTINSSVQQIESARQVTLNIISSIARVALLYGDYDNIQGYVEELPRNPGILSAMLADDRNIIVASSDLSSIGKSLPTLKNNSDISWQVTSISNPAGVLGTLAVQFSNEETNAILRHALTRGAVIAAIGMMAIAVFSIGFGHLLTRRLGTVVHAAEQVAAGNYQVRTGLSSHDEVGQVGQAFDTMAGVIAEEKRSLSRTNEELEQRVEERTSKLQEANSEYEAFAYAVSHDLRAPLRSMNGFSDILLEDYGDKLDETATGYLQRIKNASLNMSQLIDDLLTLSRVNRAEIGNQPVNLSAICQEVVDELSSHTPGRKIQVDIKPDMQVQGDPQLLRDAMMNLIGNAWKFTGKTENPYIRIGMEKCDGRTVFSIEDNGSGFDETYLDKLFVPFQRLHTNQEFPGTGIGLSTVMRVIKRHGGNIWAESRTDSGAVFRFTLGET
ncbi:phospho-acceptor domain-containing protein [Thiogranum longum]|uniref:histidine kinase n=1 Tax=Thiogranum longum TaxID=1537524 RepID=A0A4R1HF29_9GAMM|nr:ATP-binding protein [Thiogranum longum]TCK18810.1 phospho-acceptor domain-containing protein [Thiogranum longum]